MADVLIFVASETLAGIGVVLIIAVVLARKTHHQRPPHQRQTPREAVAMVSLSDAQLKTVMAAASHVPIEKRSQFFERIAAMLGYVVADISMMMM